MKKDIIPFTDKQLDDHLKKEHGVTTLSEYLKEIVFGGNDGVVTTFAVVAGFNGADLASQAPEMGIATVLIFGLANLFADASSMGLGEYLSSRSEGKLYLRHLRKESQEIKHNPAEERAESLLILEKKGISHEDALSFIELYEKNPGYWLDFMMDYELEMSKPESESPAFKAIATFAAFIVFGSIPLIPYLIKVPLEYGFAASCTATVIGLLLLGTLRWHVTKERLMLALGETLLIGGTSAVIAYGVGFLFR